MHPNGQLPAYEWAFGDVNPPVHAWAAWRVFQIDRKQRGGTGDLAFLEKVFHKSMLNFTWWVNRKDLGGRNIFQGGFLGLDNIGVFDRSSPLPTGGYLDQADGTAWMVFFSQHMLRIAEFIHQRAAGVDIPKRLQPGKRGQHRMAGNELAETIEICFRHEMVEDVDHHVGMPVCVGATPKAVDRCAPDIR
jgi:hypothetical protein